MEPADWGETEAVPDVVMEGENTFPAHSGQVPDDERQILIHPKNDLQFINQIVMYVPAAWDQDRDNDEKELQDNVPIVTASWAIATDMSKMYPPDMFTEAEGARPMRRNYNPHPRDRQHMLYKVGQYLQEILTDSSPNQVNFLQKILWSNPMKTKLDYWLHQRKRRRKPRFQEVRHVQPKQKTRRRRKPLLPILMSTCLTQKSLLNKSTLKRSICPTGLSRASRTSRKQL